MTSTRTTTREIATPLGTARAHVDRPPRAVGTLLLGHGAGGGVESADLVAARDAAVDLGWAVARVEQPWRVAGKRVAPPPRRLDEAWLPIVAALRGGRSGLPGPLVVGGRSAGARVACRTAGELGAVGVLCLAFPLHPPGKPDRLRTDELLAPAVPVLVVQGERDPFGSPREVAEHGAPAAALRVAAVPGDHSLARAAEDVRAAVRDWLPSRPRDLAE